MAASQRYQVTRGKYGSPVIHDTESRRPVLVCLREIKPDETAPSAAAEDAAVVVAQICAQALNRIAAEQEWRKQQEGGRR